MQPASADLSSRYALLRAFQVAMKELAARMPPAERHALAADIARQAMAAEEAGESLIEAALIELHTSLRSPPRSDSLIDTLAGEPERQVSTTHVLAFGIELRSSHARASELAELLRFAEAAAEVGVADLVVQAFYDSEAQVCSFEFSRSLTVGEPGERTLLAAARATLTHFDWIDHCHRPAGWPRSAIAR